MSDTEDAQSQFIIKTFPVGPLQCNCSVIGDSLSGRALVIDPGGDADHIMALVKELKLTVVAIIHTHAHLDHILAAGEIKKRRVHLFFCMNQISFYGISLSNSALCLVCQLYRFRTLIIIFTTIRP